MWEGEGLGPSIEFLPFSSGPIVIRKEYVGRYLMSEQFSAPSFQITPYLHFSWGVVL